MENEKYMDRSSSEATVSGSSITATLASSAGGAVIGTAIAGPIGSLVGAVVGGAAGAIISMTSAIKPQEGKQLVAGGPKVIDAMADYVQVGASEDEEERLRHGIEILKNEIRSMKEAAKEAEKGENGEFAWIRKDKVEILVRISEIKEDDVVVLDGWRSDIHGKMMKRSFVAKEEKEVKEAKKKPMKDTEKVEL